MFLVNLQSRTVRKLLGPALLVTAPPFNFIYTSFGVMKKDTSVDQVGYKTL